MNENLFRKKSLEKVSSPEQLNDYISVTTPGIWLFIASIILILLGGIIWGNFAKLDTIVKAPAVVNAGEAVLYVKAADALKVSTEKNIRIGDTDGKVIYIGNKSVKAQEVLGDFSLNDIGYDNDTIVYPVGAKIDINDGIYRAEIVVDSVSPLSFLFNREY